MAGRANGIMGLEKMRFPWKTEVLYQRRPAVFTGCNAVLFMPETTKKILDRLSAREYGWIYDCCGKPLEHTSAADVGVERMERRIREHQISEITVFCPNCYYYLKGKLSVPVVSLYDTLQKEAILPSRELTAATLFIPCPDRAEHHIQKSLEGWLQQSSGDTYRSCCCGLASTSSENPEIQIQRLKDANLKFRPYCASCYGQFESHGVEHCPHVLTEAFDASEAPITLFSRIKNRILPRRWKKQGV